jgi:hypothetical protein
MQHTGSNNSTDTLGWNVMTKNRKKKAALPCSSGEPTSWLSGCKGKVLTARFVRQERALEK